MQVKKITAKIRDMVKVSLMENGDECAWYNNIEMPDAIKELEMKDFGFNALMDGKIEFQIHFEQGVLPKTFPEKKARKRRNATEAVAEKPTDPARMPAIKAADKPAILTPAPKPQDKPGTKSAAPAAKAGEKPATQAPKADTKSAPAPKPEAKAAPKPLGKTDAAPASKKAI